MSSAGIAPAAGGATSSAIGSLPTAAPEAVGMSSERLDRIGTIIRAHIDQGHISGAVTALARRGHQIHLEAHGLMDVEAGVPMPTDAIFQMWSSTKVVAAVAVLILVERGLLRLEDLVSRYVPAFAGAKLAVPAEKKGAVGVVVPDAAPDYALVESPRELTIRQLMTHTAGLASRYAGKLTPDHPPRGVTEPLHDYVARLADLPLDFEPDTRWSYSPSAACDVLAAIAEMVSGKTFDVFLRDEIFVPLGMNDTHFVLPAAKVARLVPVYRPGEQGWRRVKDDIFAAVAKEGGYISGSTGLVSTAQDFLLFQQMLTNGGALNGKRILGPRTVTLMASNHVGDLYRGEGAYTVPMEGHGFGLLVQVVLDPVNGNTGRAKDAFGFGGALGTMNWSDPRESITGVIMLQQNNREVHIDFERAIRQAIVD